MSIIEIRGVRSPSPGRTEESASASSGPDRGSAPDMIPASNEELVAPVMLVQLQDDLARSHKREAFWISLVLHLGAVMSLLFAPRIFPGRNLIIATPTQLINQRELTYLDLPPDQQKPPVTPPKSNIISDKNRIATSRNPTLDRKELQKILDSS